MEYNKLEHFVSKPRLDRFLNASGASKTKAEQLYKFNLELSQSFYSILNLFEIFLRNVINNQLADYFSNPNWIITEENGFMNDGSLELSKFYLKKSVQNAESTLKRKGIAVTAGKILAEQSFGFWCSMFDPHHYSPIGGSVIHCFPHKPLSVNRKQISVKMKNIRDFRNRIYHNEPICFLGNAIDFTIKRDVKNDIYELLQWIDIDLKNYVRTFDSIDGKITSWRSGNK